MIVFPLLVAVVAISRAATSSVSRRWQWKLQHVVLRDSDVLTKPTGHGFGHCSWLKCLGLSFWLPKPSGKPVSYPVSFHWSHFYCLLIGILIDTLPILFKGDQQCVLEGDT